MNLVDEIDQLQNATDLEKTIRAEVDKEIVNGATSGAMFVAHDEALKSLVEAARRLVDKADNS